MTPDSKWSPLTTGLKVDSLLLNITMLQCLLSRSYTKETKESAQNSNFTDIPSGVNGVEDRMAVVWEKGVEAGSAKMTPERFVAVTSSNSARAFNLYPKKGRIDAGSDADIVVWNRNNLREISAKTHSQKTDFNIFEGMKVRGAPEFVLARGRLVVYEYQLNVEPGSGEFQALEPYPKGLYDLVASFAETKELDEMPKVIRDEDNGKSVGQYSNSDNPDFGLTTPRRSIVEEPIMNKRLGIYQRPLSAHGVRNQQDSTFSLSGGTHEDAYSKSSIKVHAPPGGSSGRAFW